jgi:hypothetical protein
MLALLGAIIVAAALLVGTLVRRASRTTFAPGVDFSAPRSS